MKTLASKAPDCPPLTGRPLSGELSEIVPRLAASYVEGNPLDLHASFDPERLLTVRSKREATTVTSTRACGWWGSDRLAFAHAKVSYEAESSLGQTPVLLVLRRPSSAWQLLVASRDPISTGAFLAEVVRVASLLTHGGQTSSLPVAATLLSPGDGRYPRPQSGERFGSFVWQSSPSSGIVAEIVEFAYEDDARLIVGRLRSPEGRRRVSSGELWRTNSAWLWRVWSITATGDIAFSNAWAFPN